MWEGEFVIYGIFYILCSLANARVCMWRKGIRILYYSRIDILSTLQWYEYIVSYFLFFFSPQALSSYRFRNLILDRFSLSLSLCVSSYSLLISLFSSLRYFGDYFASTSLYSLSSPSSPHNPLILHINHITHTNPDIHSKSQIPNPKFQFTYSNSHILSIYILSEQSHHLIHLQLNTFSPTLPTSIFLSLLFLFPGYYAGYLPMFIHYSLFAVWYV